MSTQILPSPAFNPELSLSYVALLPMHKDVARTSIYNSTSSTFYSGGLDGKLYAFQVNNDLVAALQDPKEVTTTSGISALCLTTNSIIVCTVDGIVFRYRNDESVDLIQPQQNYRIAAICYSETTDILAFSDWNAQIHLVERASTTSKKTTTISIPTFTFKDNSQKENSCLSMAFQDRFLILGFASGEIMIYDGHILAASRDINSALITIRSHRSPVRSIELLDPVLLKQLTPSAILNQFPSQIMPIFFSVGNDGCVFFHYPETSRLYRSQKLSSEQLIDQYLFTAKIFALNQAESLAIYLVTGGCDLQIYIYDCTVLVTTALLGTLISYYKAPINPVHNLLCANFLVPSDVWSISIIPDPSSPSCAYIIFSLEDGSILSLYIKPGPLTSSQRDATTEFLDGHFNLSTYIPASRVTGFHNSFVLPDKIYCKSPSDLPQYLNDKRSFIGRLVVTLHNSLPAIYTYLNGSWQFCGLIKQDAKSLNGEKKADSGGRKWDLALPIQNDQTGGVYTLFMNIDEDPWAVTQRFILETNIIETDRSDINSYKRQIYDFIVEHIPRTEISPIFQLTWEDATDYSLRIFPETGFKTCIINADTGLPMERPAPKAVTQELLQKCIALINKTLTDNIQYALFLNNIGFDMDFSLSETECIKTLCVRFTAVLREAIKDGKELTVEKQKILSAYFVVLSYIHLNFASNPAVNTIYKSVLLLLSGTTFSSIYTYLATGILREKAVGTFFFRLLCALIYFEEKGDVLLWFDRTVDAAHAQTLAPLIADEDLDYLEYISKDAGQNTKAFVSSLREINKHVE